MKFIATDRVHVGVEPIFVQFLKHYMSVSTAHHNYVSVSSWVPFFNDRQSNVVPKN